MDTGNTYTSLEDAVLYMTEPGFQIGQAVVLMMPLLFRPSIFSFFLFFLVTLQKARQEAGFTFVKMCQSFPCEQSVSQKKHSWRFEIGQDLIINCFHTIGLVLIPVLPLSPPCCGD